MPYPGVSPVRGLIVVPIHPFHCQSFGGDLQTTSRSPPWISSRLHSVRMGGHESKYLAAPQEGRKHTGKGMA
jgi:hypothetical protein